MKVHSERFLSLFVLLACAAIPFSAHAADTNAYLYIAHAASGRNISSATNPAYPVDLSLGGHCVLQGLTFGEIRGPVTSPAGTYAVKVSVADALNPCGNAAVFSGAIVLAAGSTSLGIVTLNGSHQVIGEIFAINLSAVAAGTSRVVVANTTPDNLTGTLTAGDSGMSPESANIAAGTVVPVTVSAGEYSLTVYPEGSSNKATGPVEFGVESRNVYLLVFAGSTANASVQSFGPLAIRDVF